MGRRKQQEMIQQSEAQDRYGEVPAHLEIRTAVMVHNSFALAKADPPPTR
jgi:hypothetical protein